MTTKTKPTAQYDPRRGCYVIRIGQRTYTGDSAAEAVAAARSGRGYQVATNGKGE